MSHIFSIVTSAYNAQAYIMHALKSIKDQTEKDYEYIIIDNGSEDNTFNIINEFVNHNPDMDIKVYHFDKNMGISGGRNAGIEKANGKYICFLDADDYWYENKLDEMKKAITKNSGYTVYCHWEDHIKDGKETLAKYRRIDNTRSYEDLLFNGNCLSTSAIVVKRESIKEVNGFDTSLEAGEEDFDCWLRLARNGAKFYMVEKPLGVWMIRSNSISAKHIAHTDAVVAMLDTHFENLFQSSLEKKGIRKKKKKVFARNYCGCARILSIENERETAKKIYFKSLGYSRMYWKSYAGLILNALYL